MAGRWAPPLLAAGASARFLCTASASELQREVEALSRRSQLPASAVQRLVEATRVAGWLRRVEGGGKLRTKSSHTYAEAASGEIAWRAQPQAAPSAPESLAGCRVSAVVARKGLPHGLSLELADAGRGRAPLPRSEGSAAEVGAGEGGRQRPGPPARAVAG